MKRKDLERRLRELGWTVARRGRRHDIRARGEEESAVPRHREVNELTAAAIPRTDQGDRR